MVPAETEETGGETDGTEVKQDVTKTSDMDGDKMVDETKSTGIFPGDETGGSEVNNNTNETESETTNGEAAPFNTILDFLSALLTKNYKEALRLSKTILKYEPNNKTVREFLNVLEEVVAGGLLEESSASSSASSSSSSSESDSSSGSSSSSSSSSESESEESDSESEGSSESESGEVLDMTMNSKGSSSNRRHHHRLHRQASSVTTTPTTISTEGSRRSKLNSEASTETCSALQRSILASSPSCFDKNSQSSRHSILQSLYSTCSSSCSDMPHIPSPEDKRSLLNSAATSTISSMLNYYRQGQFGQPHELVPMPTMIMTSSSSSTSSSEETTDDGYSS